MFLCYCMNTFQRTTWPLAPHVLSQMPIDETCTNKERKKLWKFYDGKVQHKFSPSTMAMTSSTTSCAWEFKCCARVRGYVFRMYFRDYIRCLQCNWKTFCSRAKWMQRHTHTHHTMHSTQIHKPRTIFIDFFLSFFFATGVATTHSKNICQTSNFCLYEIRVRYFLPFWGFLIQFVFFGVFCMKNVTKNRHILVRTAVVFLMYVY